MLDVAKLVWKNLLQEPLRDRVYYVPFWDCPMQCETCDVAAMPGRPPVHPVAGEPMLRGLVEGLAKERGGPVQVHVSGGEPLLRPRAIARLAEQLLTDGHLSRLILHTTLRPRGIEEILEVTGPERLRILVNPETANADTRMRLRLHGGIAEYDHNPVRVPTGRGAVGRPGHRWGRFEKLVLRSMPGRSCFATVSGPLVNGPHGTVHLCSMPASPVIGTFRERPARVLARHLETLRTWHREVLEVQAKTGASHACTVCQSISRWDPSRSPARGHLRGRKGGIPLAAWREAHEQD